jgi:uncharacterized membrane protein
MILMPRLHFRFPLVGVTVGLARTLVVRFNRQFEQMETPMSNTKTLVNSALAALATLAVTSGIAHSGPAAAPAFDNEKCYGIARAGLNDCQTSTHSCAGTATKDSQADSWIYVPAGTCAKLTGGSMTPKA